MLSTIPPWSWNIDRGTYIPTFSLHLKDNVEKSLRKNSCLLRILRILQSQVRLTEILSGGDDSPS